MPGSSGGTVIQAPEKGFLANGLIVWWQQTLTQAFNGGSEKGTDWAMPFKSPVGAIEGGRVVYAGLPPDSQVAGQTSLGYVVQVQNVDGSIIHYQHLNGLGPNIGVGSFVGNGQVIGYSGGCANGGTANTCTADKWSTGPHIEVRWSPTYNSSAGIWGQNWQNPVPYFQKLGASLKPGTVGVNTVGGAYGPTGTPSAPFTSFNCAPWDVGCMWNFISGGLVSFGEHIAVFVLALLLILIGFVLMKDAGVVKLPQAPQVPKEAV